MQYPADPSTEKETDWKMAWEHVDYGVEHLWVDIQRVMGEQPNISTIIAIGKGGVIPASLLWQRLPNAAFEVVHISSYLKTGKVDPIMHNRLPLKMYNTSDVLVVDDICDSGDTFRFVHQYIPKAKYACMLARKEEFVKNPFKYDFMGYVVNDIWVDFPWE